jgi:hypothetical protein
MSIPSCSSEWCVTEENGKYNNNNNNKKHVLGEAALRK